MEKLRDFFWLRWYRVSVFFFFTALSTTELAAVGRLFLKVLLSVLSKVFPPVGVVVTLLSGFLGYNVFSKWYTLLENWVSVFRRLFDIL